MKLDLGIAELEVNIRETQRPGHWDYLTDTSWYNSRKHLPPVLAAQMGPEGNLADEWKYFLRTNLPLVPPTDEELKSQWVEKMQSAFIIIPWTEAPDFCPDFQIHEDIKNVGRVRTAWGYRNPENGSMFLIITAFFFWDGASAFAIDTPQNMLAALAHDVVYRANRLMCFIGIHKKYRNIIRKSADRMIGRIMRDYYRANNIKLMRPLLWLRSWGYTYALIGFVPLVASDAWQMRDKRMELWNS